jgi:hypothetical protein
VLLEFRARSSGTFDGSSPQSAIVVGHNVELRCEYETPLGTAVGVNIVAVSSTSPNASGTYPDTGQIDWDFAGNSHTISLATHRDTLNPRIEVDDWTVYMLRSGDWKVTWSAVRFYDDSTLVASFGAGSSSTSHGVPVPSYIPVFNGSFVADAGASGAADPPTGIILDKVELIQAEASSNIGWRFNDGSAWRELPVSLPTIPGLPHQTVSASDVITAGTTWTTQIHNAYRLDVVTQVEGPSLCAGSDYWSYDQQLTERSATLTVVPNLVKEVVRCSDDYGALVARGGFPQTTKTSALTYYTGGHFPYASESVTAEEHPEHSQFLATLTNASHVIEDPLNYASQSHVSIYRKHQASFNECWMVAASGTFDVSTSYTWNSACQPPGMANTNVEEEFTFSFPASVGNPSSILSYVKSSASKWRYFNTWCNPHWSYQLWVPLMDGTGYQWQLNGSPEPEYWSKVRQQFLEHTSLPTGERLQIRNHVLIEPWRQTGNGLLTALENSIFGTQCWWLGVPRFDRLEAGTDTVQCEADSEPRWTVTDATATFGAGGISLAP